MRYQIRQYSSWLLLVALSVLFLGFTTQPAAAVIRQVEEAPTQMVYQSRQTLQDQDGNTWQTIAFKRIRPDGSESFYLRLVGFPGTADIDRSRPLSLISSLGQTLTAQDASNQIFTDATSPQPNVGQYDLQPLLSQLQAELPWKLSLPTTDRGDITLQVPPAVIQEWKTVAQSE